MVKVMAYAGKLAEWRTRASFAGYGRKDGRVAEVDGLPIQERTFSDFITPIPTRFL
jgi:hypothetical protein